MKRTGLAALACLCLFMSAASATAQVVAVPAGQRAEQAIRNIEQALSDAQRLSHVGGGVLSDPDLASARTLEAFAAVVERRRSEISTGRAEVQAIRARLLALPQVSRPSDPPQIATSDQAVRDVAAMADRIDTLLGDVVGVADAVRDGDQEKAVKHVQAVAGGAVTMMEVQVVTLRAQAATLPENSSARGQLSSLACLSEGAAALQKGMMGMSDRSTAATAVRSTQACTAEQSAAGRRALEREVAAPSNPTLARLTARLAPVSRNLFSELDLGAEALGQAATALARGDSAQSVAGNEFAAVQQVVMRIQALSAQAGAIQAEQLD